MDVFLAQPDGGIDVDSPTILWTSTWNHPWNVAILQALGEQWHSLLIEGRVPYVTYNETMTASNIASLIRLKLRRFRQRGDFLRSHPQSEIPQLDKQAAQKKRRYKRRQDVSVDLFLIFLALCHLPKLEIGLPDAFDPSKSAPGPSRL